MTPTFLQGVGAARSDARRFLDSSMLGFWPSRHERQNEVAIVDSR